MATQPSAPPPAPPLLYPPSLAFPPPDPFTPFDRSALLQDDDSDTLSNASSDTHVAPAMPGPHSADAGRDEYKDASDDSEGDEKTRLVGDGDAALEEGDTDWPTRAARAKRRRVCLLAFPTVAVTVLLFTFLGSHLFSGRHTYHGGGLSPISWEAVSNGSFAVERRSLDWLAEAGDGVYSYKTDDGSIALHNVKTNTSRFLVKGQDIVVDGGKLPWQTFKVSADSRYILFGSRRLKQWRHSSHSDFYIHSLDSNTTRILRRQEIIPAIAIAAFSPIGHHISYVYKNDLFVLDQLDDQMEAVRITADGSATNFNGVPDWVYEEEIFSADSATWWSPDASKIAYLSFDEHKVPEYQFPIYNPNPRKPGALAYPDSIMMRYPKPGYPNPIVTLSVFSLARYLSLPPARPTLASTTALDPRVIASTYSLAFSDPFDPTDLLITEVTWVGKDDLIVKFSNRVSTMQRVAHFSFTGNEPEGGQIIGKVIRDVDWEKLDGGWAEPGQNIVGIESTVALHSSHSEAASAAPIPTYPPGYLDIVPDSAGYSHLAYFSPPDSADPIFLTNGQWEIDGGIQAVDVVRGLVYFIAANPSIERHLYSVPLPTSTALEALRAGGMQVPPKVLSDATVQGYHRASFSPFAGFYVLNYDGPDIPWQRLIEVGAKDVKEVLADNSKLAQTMTSFSSPSSKYTTVEVNGVVLNALELRPPQMDDSGRTKYPVLFSVYGGPASQVVTTIWKRDWHHYLCTTYNYVIVYVDPRGTGFKGREFRAGVHGRLGLLEANDTVEAARHWASLPYIDEKRVGIWGWSYGGFLTSKVIEADSGVFTLGMAIAPVTNWAYYDSIYTERYMLTPKLNPEGYEESSVKNMDGFKHASFALAHGSGDDNVHFTNSANFLDRLTFAGVKDFAFRLFIDSDHSMSMRGQYWELMPWLSDFLYSHWGDGARTKNKWKSVHAGSA